MSDSDNSKSWFGSTFNKLKSALSKTKTAIVGDNPEDDSVLEQRRDQIEEDRRIEPVEDQGIELSQGAYQDNGSAPDSAMVSLSEMVVPAQETEPEPVQAPVQDRDFQESIPKQVMQEVEPEPIIEIPVEKTEPKPETQEIEPEPIIEIPEQKPEPVARKIEPAEYQSQSASEPQLKSDDSTTSSGGLKESQAGIKESSSEPKIETSEAFELRAGRSFSQALKASSVESKKVKVDEDYLEGLEERLIKADIGLSNAESLIENLRQSAHGENWTQEDVVAFLKKEFLKILKSAPSSRLSFNTDKLNIYFVVGVNGTGKTTSIGKLCWRLKQEGKKVLMAAGDTFRAAAESQLEIWSNRAQVDIVRLEDGADPGAVVYKALEKAREESYDCLVIDTAGRLHNKANLMAELKKVRNVLDKHGKGTNLESLLVVDASTGQNGLQQARVFTEICSLTGVILTKLDGTAKGGIVFSIARDLGIPVKLIGLGEQIDDLKDFEPEMFVEALL